MIIVLKPGTTKEQADELLSKIEAQGLKSLYMPGSERTVLGALGDERVLAKLHFESHPLVESVTPVLAPYKLVSREMHPHDTVVQIGPLSIGGDRFAVIAGPCSVENHEQMLETARGVKAAGAGALRGGAFKPRTSPYAFQGMGEEGLKILRDVGDKHEMPVVTEVMDPRQVDLVCKYADMLQIGARNMQNFSLLRAASRSGKPILLKRGAGATIEEWLMAAEYILAEGNPNVVLCERGIRTFERATRHTLDLNAVVMVRERTHLPVIVDPSHAAGLRSLVVPLSLGSLAAGASGLIVEVHPDPASAMSDGAQSLDLPMFADLAARVHPGRHARARLAVGS